MQRCITCDYWLVLSEPFVTWGLCIRPYVVSGDDVERTEPGYSCEDYEAHKTTSRAMQVDLAKDYLVALIGRERAEFGSIAWEAYCEEIGKLYQKLSPQMQINTHDAF